MSYIRLHFVRLLLSAMLLLFFTCFGRQASAFTIVVTEPQTPLVPNSVIELAARMGYFKREGVNVDFMHVSGTPTAIAALLSGHGDMANVSLQSLLKLSARGETGIRAVASPNKSLSFMIVGRDSIASLSDLRGKIFGIGQPGTLDNTLTWQVLRHGGLDPKELRVVSVGHPHSRLLALASGKIDATTASIGSWLTLPDKKGLHVIVSKDAYFRAAPVVAKVNVVSQTTLAEKHDQVVKVTAALMKLSRLFAAHPQRWAKAMHSARPDMPPAKLQALADAYAHDWCVNGGLDRSELERSAELLAASPSFKGEHPAPVEAWADFSIVNEVLGRIGLDTEAAADRQ
ncbi:MAG TPA: ABC transporter substrate-binding protein [Pseudolabrys sp.]|jgi:NitT/TauT family transport system substrate-binding protein|nr:ABC transporter substrate-binding protein [Pseudolabrys sp.]